MDTKITKEEIKKRIVEVRGKKVMLASELARLFELETRVLNQMVKRNINLFTNDSYFQLIREENKKVLRLQNSFLKSQTVTSSSNNYGGVRYLPYVFTREGIETLSHILKAKKLLLFLN